MDGDSGERAADLASLPAAGRGFWLRMLARKSLLIAVAGLLALLLLPGLWRLRSDNSPEVFFVSGSPAVDSEGRAVAFQSTAENLVEDDSNHQIDVFVNEVGDGCDADVDGDGSVGASDLGMVLGAWDRSGFGDLNGDGQVGSADLAILLGQWGACR